MSQSAAQGRWGRWGVVLAAGFWLLVPGWSQAADQDQDRDRDRDQTRLEEPDRDQLRTRDQLRDQLRTGAGLSDAELKAVDPELAGYAKQNGDPAVLAETVRAAKGDGCTGVCLRETVRTMNRAMQQGMACPEAGEMTRAVVREQARARAGGNDQQLAQRIQERATERLREREQARPDPQMERQMKREGQRGVSGGPPGAGGAGGGGKR